ncbi:hypothetical protein BsWGS_16907 [Bradybaena similaris]
MICTCEHKNAQLFAAAEPSVPSGIMWIHNTTAVMERLPGATDSCPHLFCNIRLATHLLLLEVLGAVAYVIWSILYKKDKRTGDPDEATLASKSTSVGNTPQASGSKVTLATDLDQLYREKLEQPIIDNTEVTKSTRTFNFQVPVDILTAMYAVAIAVGGIFDYIKAGSSPSLVMGIACGTLMMVAAYQLKQSSTNFHLALVTSAVEAGVMIYMFAVSDRFLPSGLLAILSLPMVLRFGYMALVK